MANVHEAQGDDDKALELYGKALKIDLATLGESHPDMEDMCNDMAVVHEAQGDYDKARELRIKAHSVSMRTVF